MPIPRPTILRSRPPPGRSRTLVGRGPLDTMERIPRLVVSRSRPPAFLLRSRTVRTSPHREEVLVSGALRADYRVEDTTIAGYELYIGQDAEPDLSGSPDETFSSLPHESGALAAGHDYYLVTRYRNAYGLVSRNLASWRLTVDGGGAAEALPPSPPAAVLVEAASGGTVRIEADYCPGADGDDAATIWAIWITSDGSAPDPDNDPATATETMTDASGFVHLDYTTGAYADGLTIKVVVRTRRVDAGPVNVDSTNTAVSTVEADTDGPAAPSGGIFHDEDAEEAQ